MDALKRVEVWLSRNRPEYYRQLQPGASEKDLEAFEQQSALRLPAGLRTLYGWRDGQREECTASLVDNRMFMSLAASASMKAMLDSMIDTEFDDPHWWRREWLPFLDNGAGDYLVVDSVSGRVLTFWHDDALRSVEFNGVGGGWSGWQKRWRMVATNSVSVELPIAAEIVGSRFTLRGLAG